MDDINTITNIVLRPIKKNLSNLEIYLGILNLFFNLVSLIFNSFIIN